MRTFRRLSSCRVVFVTLTAILSSLALLLTGHALLRSADEAKPLGGADKLDLRQGDHICIIGNTLAERMQHDGWLETYFHKIGRASCRERV